MASRRGLAPLRTARHAAHTAEDQTLLAHAKGEQAYALIDVSRPDDALSLLIETRALHGRSVPRRLRSRLCAAEAEAAAVAGRVRHTHRALEAADKLVPTEPSDPEMPYVTLDVHHLERWRGSCLARVGDAHAVNHLESALQYLSSDFTRARGALHLDLVEAYRADPERAQHHEFAAREIIMQTGSVRQHARLTRLAA